MRRWSGLVLLAMVALPGGSQADPSDPPVPVPAPKSLSPTAGPVGEATAVTVIGTILDRVTSVTFGGEAAQILSQGATFMNVNTPKRATPGTVDVVFTNATGSTT